jgi:hypothetical protein
MGYTQKGFGIKSGLDEAFHYSARGHRMHKASSYQRAINPGLDRAYRRAPIRTVRLERLKLAIFSDHHKGIGDEADDFRLALPAYGAALEHYFGLGHTLVVLGDAEELWEDFPGPVLKEYAALLELENAFHKEGRYWRFWGNHDDEWRDRSQVDRYLGRYFGDLVVWESLRLFIEDGSIRCGELLLVHGHQGTLVADLLGEFSRLVIRYLWRPIQRSFRIRPNTPATDLHLRHRHDVAMHKWAAQWKRLILIAGHTHHPIFPSAERITKLTEEYAWIRELSVDMDEIRRAEAELQLARAQQKPSYFNSGCCCFNDGRITGIEIAEGEIRLVRWADSIGRLQPEILDRLSLRNVFEELACGSVPMPAATT